MTTATRLPAVPGATGEYPAPPTVAITRASRSSAVGAWLGALGDELVAFDIDDPRPRESPGLERASKIDDAVDLGRLPRDGPSHVNAGSSLRPSTSTSRSVPISFRFRSQAIPSWT